MELVRAEAKLDMIHVPFRGGSPAIQALIAGDVQIAVEGLPSLPGHLKSGAVRPVAVTSGKRAPTLPEVPALAETIPNFDASAWVICFMPAGAPQAAIDRMATEARRALTDPTMRSRLSEMGATAEGTSVADTLRFHRSELAKFRRAVEISGAKPDQ